MATEYGLLRSKMFDYLKRNKEGTFDVLGKIRRYLKSEGIECDNDDLRTIEQIIHELYLEGVVLPGIKLEVRYESTAPFMVFPRYHLTAYGEETVEAKEYQPYDPDGYLAKIKDEIPDVDEVIIRYLEECLSCFGRNLLLAAAVMLGCAAEKAVLLLVQAYGATLSGAEKDRYEKETKSFLISRKWRALWKRLEPLSSGLPNGLGDDLGTILERVFDIIRTTRNDAGHPTGKTVQKEAVHANLLLLPIFFRRIFGLVQHFSIKRPTDSTIRQ